MGLNYEFIKTKTKIIQNKNPYYSSYLSFANAIKGLQIPPREVEKNFDSLVSPKDYLKSERDTILKHLNTITK